MTNAVLGVIGGSGIYDLPGLENAREQAIVSPWGDPSWSKRGPTSAGLNRSKQIERVLTRHLFQNS